MIKHEFCLNSRRWITFLFAPLKSCPLYQEQLLKCESCGYYELKITNKYFLRKMKLIKEIK